MLQKRNLWIWIRIYAYTYASTLIHTNLRLYIRIYAYTYASTLIHTNLRLYIRIYAYTYESTLIHTNLRLYVRIYAYTYESTLRSPSFFSRADNQTVLSVDLFRRIFGVFFPPPPLAGLLDFWFGPAENNRNSCLKKWCFGPFKPTWSGFVSFSGVV